MYSELFNRCIDVVLRHEGGYVNNPADPGGETNFGICKRNYPDLDIKNLTKEQAIDIYYRGYWLKRFEEITSKEAVLEVFDMGVNSGMRTAIKIAQRLVHAFCDGILGDETVGMINDFPLFVELYKADRKKFYIALARRKPELEVFLKGWLNRVDQTKFENNNVYKT